MKPRGEELSRHNVLTHPPDILPGKCRGLYGDFFSVPVPLLFLDMFDHDYGIGLFWQHMAGVYKECVFSHNQVFRGCFACAIGFFCRHRDSVHGRCIEVGGRQSRKDGFCQHAARGIC